MKTSNVTNKPFISATNQTFSKNLNKKVSFGCSKYTTSRALKKEISKNLDGLPKTLVNLGKNTGEIMSILVTAVGTAFVAPLFIAFNPLSKEDKETTIYSALRQPISAVIAVATQVGINKKFNNWIDKLASEGKLDKADLTSQPQKTYLKSIIKKENPKITKEDLRYEIETRQDKAFDTAIKKTKEAYKNGGPTWEELIRPKMYKDTKSELIKELGQEEFKKLSAKDANNKIIQKAADKLKKCFETEASEIAKSRKIQLEEALQEVKIENLVGTQIKNAQTVLKNFKNYAGIGLSLAMLPISCSLLNWAYPRIMEKIMPEATAKKHLKEANNENIS
ncbi:MAG: hypothetical protein PHV68_00410 [Candidatus Gastranaerophilales bacterium]|nr:hypothetical protein [Candidatus Gastranaerophilales bacterium]